MNAWKAVAILDHAYDHLQEFNHVANRPNVSWTEGDQEAIQIIFKKANSLRRSAVRKERHEAMTDLGLVRVRGALGGVYYE